MGKFLDSVLAGKYGWKVISSAVALVIMVVLHQTGHLTAEQFNTYTKLAEALGLVGLRTAYAELTKAS